MHRLWGALFLLVCSLASAPLGSMEQAGAALSGSGAHVQSVPVARPAGETLALAPAIDLPDPAEYRAPGSSPAPFGFRAPAPLAHALPAPTSRPTPGELLPDRLTHPPYHATAPPARVTVRS